MNVNDGGVRPLLQGLGIAASGVRAHKARIDVIAGNLANAGTSAPPGTEPFRRQMVRLAAVEGGGAVDGGESGDVSEARMVGGVQVVGIEEDLTEGPLVYDPGHPDADDQGYVRLSNVDTTREMVDLLEARRLFEANASVFEAMKAVLRRSIDL